MGGQQSKSAEAKIPKTVIDETGLETHTMTIHDKRLTEGEGKIIYRGPLSQRQLQQLLRQSNDDSFFIIKFPMFNSQTAYLDTVNYTLKFRGEDDHDLSVLMKLELSSTALNEIRWSTLVMQNRYYSVTDSGGPVRGSRSIEFLQYEKPEDAPIWKFGARNLNMLTFSQTVNGQVWSSQPAETQQQKQVLGLQASINSIHAYQVTSFPQIPIEPPGTNDK